MKISIIGTGHTNFGKAEESIGDLMRNVCNEALIDADITIDDVDMIYVSNFSSSFSNQCHLPAILSSKLEVSKEITRVESACAAGGLALKEAAIALSSGLYNVVLVVGVEKMSERIASDVMSTLATAASFEEIKHGASFPSLYAMMAQRHFFEFGTTEEHLAMISVNNHKNALYNPLAQFHKEISIDDVMKSKMIASPIKLLDCSPVSDGAAAIVLSNENMAVNKNKDPVHLIGIGHDTSSINLFDRKELTTLPATIRAAEKAYKMSGVKPKDIDVAEVHDCFTIAQLMQIEDLGFCKKGTGKNFIEEGNFRMDGELPINPSGGLKAKGHPIGATGISQVVEIVKQLKGECGKRQAEDPEIGLCSNVGGTGASAIVSIFSR